MQFMLALPLNGLDEAGKVGRGKAHGRHGAIGHPIQMDQ